MIKTIFLILASLSCMKIAMAIDFISDGKINPLAYDKYIVQDGDTIGGYPFFHGEGKWVKYYSSMGKSTGTAVSALMPLIGVERYDNGKWLYSQQIHLGLGGAGMGGWGGDPCGGDKIIKINIIRGGGLDRCASSEMENAKIGGISTDVLSLTFAETNTNGRFYKTKFSIHVENNGLNRRSISDKSSEFNSDLKEWMSKFLNAIVLAASYEKPNDAFKGIQFFTEKYRYLNTQSLTTTAPPTPVPATTTEPARAAAIANVEVTVKAPVGQVVPNQPTQVTTNPLDQLKKTSGNEVWISFNPSITVQERQFCRIVENFRTENGIAVQSKNQIKVNETYRNLTQSLNSLLPDGKFQGWVMRTVAVDQASDGSAEVLLELPCNIYVGSNACDVNPKNYYGTAPEGSRMYTELAKMTVGDFALTSGQFVYTDDKAFDKNRSVASFRFMRTAAHCKAKEVSTDSEFFGMKLDVISTIK
jgi:hypothetical protein